MQLSELQFDVKRQMQVENAYSRQNIRKMVKTDIKECQELQDKIYVAEKLLIKWIEQDHYSTKKDCLNELMNLANAGEFNIQDMIIDILTVVLSLDYQAKMTQIVGQCEHILPFDDYMVRIKRMGEILYQLCVADLFDITRNVNNEISIINRYGLDGDTAKYIEQAKFLPPMLCKPNKIYSLRDSAYLTARAMNVSKVWNQDERDICLDVLNMSNQMAFSLDIELLKFMDEEMPEEIKNFKHRSQQFESLVTSTQEVCIELFHGGNKFYFAHFYDARGRLYCRGYHCSYQGNSYRKAMLNFHETVEVTIDDEYLNFFN